MSVYKLLECLSNTESSFAAQTNTFAQRIPVVGDVTVDLQGERIQDQTSQSRLAEQFPGHPGPRRATLSFKTYAPGLVDNTIWLHLLSNGLGGSNTESANTTVATSTDADTFTLTSAAAAAEIWRIGVKNDGRGDGAPTVATSASEWQVALPAAANVGDTAYQTHRFFHDESMISSLTTLRFLVGRPGTGEQIALYGCQMSQIKPTFPIGVNELPMLEFTYECAYWERITFSIPSATTTGLDQYCGPVAGGSLHIQDVGTTTRNIFKPAEVDLSLNLELQPVFGGTVVGQYQNISGWVRTGIRPELTVKVPWVSTFETIWDRANDTYTYSRILFATNHTPSRSFGFHMPRAFIMGPRPSHMEEINGQSYVTARFGCREFTDTSSAFTRASLVLWIG